MQVVAHESELGAWCMAFAAPAPLLAGIVEQYVGYHESGTAFLSRREMPGTSLVLIINLGAELRITDTLGQQFCFGMGQGFGAGLSDSYATSETGGAQEGVQVFFTPLGARRLFGLPLGDLFNRVVRLEDLFGAFAAELAERLLATDDWAARFALLDAALLARLKPRRREAALAATAWAHLAQSHGGITVSDLAASLDCSRKHLTHVFHEQVGLTPKTSARLFRFRHALSLIDAAPANINRGSIDWCHIAFDAGYYDQAHLIRDFRAFSGSAPGDFLARRLPDNGGYTG
ncbi:helix-turn-helix domain-containing protein [Ferrovibrio sp.]|uniref:helix-turn-helix domain-containing protein n=1 Tax=Ferrovibrio sp. TaxID=1917215 RepID=UPI003D11D14E